MKVLVTGGAEFIGRNLGWYLIERPSTWAVTVLDALTYAGNLDSLPAHCPENPRSRFAHGNIRNRALAGDLAY